MEEDFDYRAAEAREQDVLLDKPISFKAGNREYTIKQPYLGTLDYLAAEFLKLSVDREKLESDDTLTVFEEQKRMIAPNAKILARIVAIATINDFRKIPFLTRYYAFKFLWSVKPSDLLKLASIILRSANMPDFTNSIVLLSVNRTTAPQTIED